MLKQRMIRVDTTAHRRDHSIVGNTESFRWRTLGWLTIILLIAAAIRLHDLVSHAYMLDEDWSLEIATGRGSVHQHLPTDQIIAPPPAFFFIGRCSAMVADLVAYGSDPSAVVFAAAAVLGGSLR